MPLPKPPVPTYELTVPSTNKVIKYRPFLVKEEKLLLISMESEDETMIRNAVIDILKNCILTRGFKVEQLSMFDVEYIFLKIRSKSVGERVEMKLLCKDDNETRVTYELDLEKVEVQFPEGHDKKIMLNENSGIVMKYPGFDQFIKTQILQKNPTTEEVFDIVIDSVDKIFEDEEVWESSTTSRKEIAEYVEGLTTAQFEKIQKFFVTMPKLSHTIKIKNPNTGVESEYEIEGLVNFFG
jgi:6-pyruvoyl-tetrahydropterin synthase